MVVIERRAAISPCGSYRWTLSRRWDKRLPVVCWIMLNPSTADARRDDPTVRTIMRFSQEWGYGALVVVNLYPYRTSSPRDLREWLVSGGRGDVLRENRRYVRRAVARSQMTMAAWGASPLASRSSVRRALLPQSAQDPLLRCLGLTADGSPKHPLARGRHRVPADAQPVLFALTVTPVVY